ncbi:23554_t:CDS:2 [Dentiscutata erythropus]|uniref:23554_t:CDS:1 n=1 Tax=Dentiscutata erythropus TaxID=1348616 RepID=A0A9N9I224_9GLOM|nr:23554_t:CDS:2 [Dentiscutata erythropus]
MLVANIANSNPSNSTEILGTSGFQYKSRWRNKIAEYKFGENDSDTDDNIDEVRRQLKLDKNKRRPLAVICQYNLAGNAYLEKEGVSRDSQSYITTEVLANKQTKKIKDIFNYYYRKNLKQKNTYLIEAFNEDNKNQLYVLLNKKTKLFPEACALEKVNAESAAIFILEDIIFQHRSTREILSDQEIYSCNTLFGKDWDKYIALALFAYRTTVHSVMGYTPFYLLYGREFIFPIETNFITYQTRPGTEEELQEQIYRRLENLLVTKA